MSTNPSNSALERLAQFISGPGISPDQNMTEVVRLALIDSLGCMLLGADQMVTQNTLNTVAGWGEGNAVLVGQNQRLAAPWAAMVNGVAAHSLDFDDWEIPGNTHPSAVLFPALLAGSEGKRISGYKLVKAYIAGFEVIARLGEALNFEHYDNGWHTTSSLGTIGAGAACACLLDLDAKQTANAMAISVSMSGGLTRQFGSTTKPLHAGIAAKSGLMAAQLSAQGLTGNTDIMQGKRGFNALTAHGDESRFNRAMDKLGTQLAIAEYGIAIKPYPSCSYIHRLINCAFQIQPKIKTSISQITSIKASLPDFHAAICPVHHPIDRRQAMFSVPYCCALALLGRTVEHNDFDESNIGSKSISALIKVTEVQTRQPNNPELNFDPQDPDWLEVSDAKGNCWRSETAYPLGSPQNPMSQQQIYQKFKSNSGFALTAALSNWTESKNINTVIDGL